MSASLPPSIDHPHTRTFNGVQMLRAFAASIVVAVHASRLWSMHVSGSKEALMWSAGNSGVDIFFVISGFVMALTTAKDGKLSHPGFRFLIRRAARVYPMYWLSTLPWMLGRPSATQGQGWSKSYVVTSFLLLPSTGPTGPTGPINGVGWTLVYEMFFYMLMACALGLRVRPLRMLAPLLVLLAVAGSILEHSHMAVAQLAVAQLASPLLLEFLAGMFLATLVPRLMKLPRTLLALTAVVSCAALLLDPLPMSAWSRALIYGLPAALLVASFIGLERSISSRIPRLALLLGSASYVLYLTHILTLNRINHLPLGLDRAGDVNRFHEFVYVLLILALASVVAVIAHKLIELPLQRVLAAAIRRFERKWMSSTTALHEGTQQQTTP